MSGIVLWEEPEPEPDPVPNSISREVRDYTVEKCVLIDLSGSMSTKLREGGTRYSKVRELLPAIGHSRIFTFNDHCYEQPSGWDLPQPIGGTNLTDAFQTLKRNHIGYAVLMTDGRPDNARTALNAALGLILDIVYIGDPPRPPFLDELAALCGGSVRTYDLGSQASELTDDVLALIGPPPSRR